MSTAATEVQLRCFFDSALAGCLGRQEAQVSSYLSESVVPVPSAAHPLFCKRKVEEAQGLPVPFS